MLKPPAPGAAAADLIAFWESTCSVAIPPVAKRFWLRAAGYSPRQFRFTVLLADGTRRALRLQRLCTLAEVAENWPFDKELTFYHDLMTLGTTPGPEMLFVGVRPWNADQLFVLDAEGEPALVARNLDEFLAGKFA